jgi:hypothetical protein
VVERDGASARIEPVAEVEKKEMEVGARSGD